MRFTKVIGARLSPALAQAVAESADANEVTESTIIRLAVKEFIARLDQRGLLTASTAATEQDIRIAPTEAKANAVRNRSKRSRN